MKLNYFVFAGLFVLGCASAKAFPQEVEQPVDGDGNVVVDPPQDSENGFVLDGNANADGSTAPTALFESAVEIREYVVNKLREIYSMLKGRKSQTDIEAATRLDFEHLPQFEDPLYVGNFTKKYKLATVDFFNVRVIGARNFRSADVKTDQNTRTVDLHLTASNLRIVGNYHLSNIVQKSDGPFIVKLLNNVTYHESSVYCRLKSEVDIATSRCGMRYGKSDNDYGNLGFFTQLFRSAISCPMIDEVLQSVSKEIGHKMRPILLSKLHETVIGRANIAGLETLIRSSMSEARNLLAQDEYKTVVLDGEAEKVQYGTHDGTVKSISLTGVNLFEITQLETPIENDRIQVKAVLHNTDVKGTATVEFVENDAAQPRVGATTVPLPFDVEDLAVDITFEKELSNDEARFVIRKLEVTVGTITTHPPEGQGYDSQVEGALRDFLPAQLRSVLTTRFVAVARTQIQNILGEA